MLFVSRFSRQLGDKKLMRSAAVAKAIHMPRRWMENSPD
jgi:hypothetical protein